MNPLQTCQQKLSNVIILIAKTSIFPHNAVSYLLSIDGHLANGRASMPMYVEWDNEEKTVIRVTTEGQYTWNEYTEAIDEVIRRADENDQVYGVIAMRSADAVVPSGATPHYARTTRLFKERPSLIVVNVKSEPFVKVMTEMFAKVHDVTQQLYQAKSIEEARAILKQVVTKRQSE